MTFHFGKYKGIEIQDVPFGYLDWCIKNLTDVEDAFLIEVLKAWRIKYNEGLTTEDYDDW